MGPEEIKARRKEMTDGELLDAFLTAMGEVAPDTEEEINAFLVEHGYDIDELNKRSKEEMDKLLKEHKPVVGCDTDEP